MVPSFFASNFSPSTPLERCTPEFHRLLSPSKTKILPAGFVSDLQAYNYPTEIFYETGSTQILPSAFMSFLPITR